MAAAGIVRERDLRVLSAAIGLSALGDGVALVALGLQAKHMSGEGMGERLRDRGDVHLPLGAGGPPLGARRSARRPRRDAWAPRHSSPQRQACVAVGARGRRLARGCCLALAVAARRRDRRRPGRRVRARPRRRGRAGAPARQQRSSRPRRALGFTVGPAVRQRARRARAAPPRRCSSTRCRSWSSALAGACARGAPAPAGGSCAGRADAGPGTGSRFLLGDRLVAL